MSEMSRGYKAGDAHAGCPRGGVLLLQFREWEVGKTTRGVIGMPVFDRVITHFTCDACGAMFSHPKHGLLLTKHCERLRRKFVSPVDRLVACPRCPADKSNLVEVYLVNEMRDNFSRSARPHGIITVLCLRCDQLVWAFNYLAEEQRAEDKRLEDLKLSFNRAEPKA